MESQPEAVKRIEIHLKKIFVARLGKNPDPQALKAGFLRLEIFKRHVESNVMERRLVGVQFE